MIGYGKKFYKLSSIVDLNEFETCMISIFKSGLK